MPPKVEHHGKAHVLLMVLLFLASVAAFGGWTGGPVVTGAKVAMSYVGFVGSSAASGSFANVASVAETITMFAISLVIYYVLAAIIIFFYNLFFG